MDPQKSKTIGRSRHCGTYTLFNKSNIYLAITVVQCWYEQPCYACWGIFWIQIHRMDYILTLQDKPWLPLPAPQKGTR
jgi:hypothetical protein